jgi:RNA-directed DNA polymerase
MDTLKAYHSAPVPDEARPAEAIRARWAWTAPEVWTDRMLTALEEGVKGDVWFSLIDKVYAERTLKAAWQHVKANGGAAGVDHRLSALAQRVLCAARAL